MELKQDTKNVLITFGIVTFMLFVGGDVYARKELLVRTHELEAAEGMLATEKQTMHAAEEQIRTLSEAVDTMTRSLNETPVLISTTSAPVRVHAVSAAAPTRATPPTPTKTTPSNDIAALAAQLADMQKAADALTVDTATTQSVVDTNTQTTVRKSRRSRAS